MTARIRLILLFLLGFQIEIFAHGEVETISFGIPLIVYLMILPYFISVWDYKYIRKNNYNVEFSKKGLWIENYLIVLIPYSLFLLVADKLEKLSNYISAPIIIVSLLLLQTIGKSLLYKHLNASKNISFCEILKSIYKFNIIIILTIIILSFMIYGIIK